MKRGLVLATAVLASLVLGACDPIDWNDPNRGKHTEVVAGTDIVIKDAAACMKHGGQWRPVCMAQNPYCVTAFADAGKACTDGSQCLGACLVDEKVNCNADKSECIREPMPEAGSHVAGVCQRDTNPCGTFMHITDGVADVAIAVD